MKVWITRPIEQAQVWVEHLRSQGIDAFPLPLLKIVPHQNTERLHTAWQHINNYQACMFVSKFAAHYFFSMKPATTIFTPRAWCTGPGTRQTLMDWGVDNAQIDSPGVYGHRFDSEALWELLYPFMHQYQSVLMLRGGDKDGIQQGRDWLERQLITHGIKVYTALCYQRQLIPRRPILGIWVLTSVASVCALQGKNWQPCIAIATHPRIAEATYNRGFRQVFTCRPILSDIVNILRKI
jgi:uroporphyrinogen-III synthase